MQWRTLVVSWIFGLSLFLIWGHSAEAQKDWKADRISEVFLYDDFEDESFAEAWYDMRGVAWERDAALVGSGAVRIDIGMEADTDDAERKMDSDDADEFGQGTGGSAGGGGANKALANGLAGRFSWLFSLAGLEAEEGDQFDMFELQQDSPVNGDSVGLLTIRFSNGAYWARAKALELTDSAESGWVYLGKGGGVFRAEVEWSAAQSHGGEIGVSLTRAGRRGRIRSSAAISVGNVDNLGRRYDYFRLGVMNRHFSHDTRGSIVFDEFKAESR